LNPFSWFGGSSEPPPRGSGKLERLQAEWLAKQSAIFEKFKRIAEDISEVPLTPRRQDVQVIHFGLAWVPTWA
jgi:hypothetical protein